MHYRGGAPMMADVLTGRVDFAVPTVSTSRAFLTEKKLRAVATDAQQRWAGLPDVPTLTEAGYGKEKVANWFGVAGPAGMPKAIVEKLRDEFIKASRDPELQRRLGENGTPIVTSTPEEMQVLMVGEAATMNELVRTLVFASSNFVLRMGSNEYLIGAKTGIASSAWLRRSIATLQGMSVTRARAACARLPSRRPLRGLRHAHCAVFHNCAAGRLSQPNA